MSNRQALRMTLRFPAGVSGKMVKSYSHMWKNRFGERSLHSFKDMPQSLSHWNNLDLH